MDGKTRCPKKHLNLVEAVQSAIKKGEEPFDEGVYRRLHREGYRFEFFQAVRLLELLFPGEPSPGETTAYAAAPIRLRPSVELVFPSTDVEQINLRNERSAEVVVTFMGLYGVDSPLPYYFYEDLATEDEDTLAHRDFLDLFNQRLYEFFYRAWKKYRPSISHRSDGTDRHSKRFIALSGLGTGGALDELPLRGLRLASHAGLLGRQVRNAVGLESIVKIVVGELPVEVVENVGRWVTIPSRGKVGDGGFQLGKDATLGQRVYDRSGKFRLRIGPMSVDQYLALLPGREGASRVQAAVRSYIPDLLDFDVELRVRSDDLPPTQLGSSTAQLGLTTNLGTPTKTVISRVVQYDQRGTS